MSSFKEFMDVVKRSPAKALPAPGISLATIQASLLAAVAMLVTPSSVPNDEKRRFAEDVSTFVRDETFLSNVSDRIGEPLDHESEDEFVRRGKNTLRKMLYDRFGVKG